MGIKRSEAADDAPELSFSELFSTEGNVLVVVPVSLLIDELRGLMAG